MTAAGTAVVTDPRPGAPAYVASVYADGPAPRDGEAGWYAFAEVEGRVVGTGFGDTEEDALRSLAGELGLEVRP